MDKSKGDGNFDEKDGLPLEGPYDPRKDPTLTKLEWRYIKRIKYDYYLMDKEVLEIIEQREKSKEEEIKMELEAKLLQNIRQQQNDTKESNDSNEEEGFVENFKEELNDSKNSNSNESLSL